MSGVVEVRVPNKQRLEHTGITVELIGDIIDFTNDANVINFLHEVKEVEKPGAIMGRKVEITSCGKQ